MFVPNLPASDEAIKVLLQATEAKPLPSEYVEFLRHTNGGEGSWGDQYANLWRAEDLIDFNRDYQVEELAPAFFLIGSNGGGEAYAFDQTSASSALFILPLIGMEAQYAVKIADSFASFVAGESRDL